MTQDIHAYMQQLGQQARHASTAMSRAEASEKNAALFAIADLIDASAEQLKIENAKDLASGKSNGLDEAMLDRLELNDARIAGMSEGLRQIAALPDPVGEISDMAYRPSGIQIGKMRVPLGVIGIIYESRPNVTADAAGLCLKSGNAAILRGGSEAIHSNKAIEQCVQQGLAKAGLPAQAIQLVQTIDRALVGEMIIARDFIDVIIPRGGKGLIKRISDDARVPVIKHLDGICHVYIDAQADLDKAINITVNAKTHRYGVCNALETLLVNQSVASTVLPLLAEQFEARGVELRGCADSCEILSQIKAASDEDWDTEYLAPILSIRIVDSLDDAITHINFHGSHHTDSIVTENYSDARRFLREVDSSSVMVNASTRFADGFEYGLGAEIGISTDKIHARGPVGLEGLTSQKYVVLGDGQIRD